MWMNHKVLSQVKSMSAVFMSNDLKQKHDGVYVPISNNDAKVEIGEGFKF